MILTDAYFDNIKEKILSELTLASKSIYVAVAWFTDADLFEALLGCQKKGVQVYLAVVRDDINMSGTGLQFGRLSEAGGKFFAISGDLMHNKFCVIDGEDVITGSYNWTYKASHSNAENIIFTSGDYDLALKYIGEFNRIAGIEKGAGGNADINKVIKRLQVLKGLIQLEEDEDLLKHAGRIRNEAALPELEGILDSISKKNYADAVGLIENFIAAYSRVIIYEDPMISALRLEIRDLEYRILAFDNEISEAEKIVRTFNHLFNKYLGELVEGILRMKKEYSYYHREESKYSQSEYEEAKKRYEQYSKEREEEEAQKFFELDIAGEEELKKIYRAAALLCHPDKVPDQHKEEAGELFKELSDANTRKDLNKVKVIYEQLKKGIFKYDYQEVKDTDLLRLKVEALRRKLRQKEAELEGLHTSDAYKLSLEATDLDTYFETQKPELIKEYEYWQERTAESVHGPTEA